MTYRVISAAAALLLSTLCLPSASFGFTPFPQHHDHISRKRTATITRPSIKSTRRRQSENNNDNDNIELDELSRPSISFSKHSILFDEDAPTEKNNLPLLLWQETKAILPNFVTGAYGESDGDRDPVEYLYNLLFVRLPVVLMGIVYVNNLLHGHGLYINFGHATAPFEVPFIIVFGVIYVILR